MFAVAGNSTQHFAYGPPSVGGSAGSFRVQVCGSPLRVAAHTHTRSTALPLIHVGCPVGLRPRSMPRHTHRQDSLDRPSPLRSHASRLSCRAFTARKGQKGWPHTLHFGRRPTFCVYGPFTMRRMLDIGLPTICNSAKLPCIFRKIEGRRAVELHRAVGGSSDGKGGKIPPQPLLCADKSALCDFYPWKFVDFRKNHGSARKKPRLKIKLLHRPENGRFAVPAVLR